MKKFNWDSLPQLPPDDRIIKPNEATIGGVPLSQFDTIISQMDAMTEQSTLEQLENEIEDSKKLTKGDL